MVKNILQNNLVCKNEFLDIFAIHNFSQTAEVTVTDDDNGKELICSIETPNPYYHLEDRKNVWVQRKYNTLPTFQQIQNARNPPMCL